jgi:hypothetical protein
MFREIAVSIVLLASTNSLASSCPSAFDGKWQRDIPVMHPQVDLAFKFNPANSSLSLNFIRDEGASFTETYIVDGNTHPGDGVHTGKVYSASCKNFEIQVVQDSQGHGLVQKTFFLDMVGLSAQTVAEDRSLNSYGRYTRTNLDH